MRRELNCRVLTVKWLRSLSAGDINYAFTGKMYLIRACLCVLDSCIKNARVDFFIEGQINDRLKPHITKDLDITAHLARE